MGDGEPANPIIRRLIVILQLAIGVPLGIGVVECAAYFNLI